MYSAVDVYSAVLLDEKLRWVSLEFAPEITFKQILFSISKPTSFTDKIFIQKFNKKKKYNFYMYSYFCLQIFRSTLMHLYRHIKLICLHAINLQLTPKMPQLMENFFEIAV